MINQIILKQNQPHYQEGIHFENPQLKHLTKKDISELIQELTTLETEFPDDKFVRTFKKHDYHYSTFMLSSNFDYELTKQDILNPTDNKLKDLFAYLSNLLFTPDDSQYESLILSNIVDAVRERFTYTQLVELLEHLAYPELIGFDGITVHYIYTLILRKSPFGYPKFVNCRRLERLNHAIRRRKIRRLHSTNRSRTKRRRKNENHCSQLLQQQTHV